MSSYPDVPLYQTDVFQTLPGMLQYQHLRKLPNPLIFAVRFPVGSFLYPIVFQSHGSPRCPPGLACSRCDWKEFPSWEFFGADSEKKTPSECIPRSLTASLPLKNDGF